MTETNETNCIGWTEFDVEPDFPAALSTLRSLGKQDYYEARALFRWSKGYEPAPLTAEDIETAVRSEMSSHIDDMVNAAVDRLRDALNDDLPGAVKDDNLYCSGDSWQDMLEDEGPAETIRQLCTEIENNIDLVVSNLGPVELGMPSDLERRVAESLRRPESPYIVKLAKRIHDQTGLPRPVVAKMLEPFTYAGPVRDRLLQYSEEDIQTASHLTENDWKEIFR